MATTDDPTANLRATHHAIPRQRTSPDLDQVFADDRLIEDLRSGRITEDNCDCGLTCLLVRWRTLVGA